MAQSWLRTMLGIAALALGVDALPAGSAGDAAPRRTWQREAPTTADRPALAPDEALRTFVLEPGYRLDLVAAEPLVQDPVAFAFDEHGALYVVENRGYPDPLEGEPDAAPRGRIARLTDRDGDGRFDTRSEFATGLTYPNGVQPWNGGVFVTMAPDLLYLKDTDGDGVADERRAVLTGFNATRTAQIRFSHPALGPDGWIYLTSGLNGGHVIAPAHPERPAVDFSASDSRYHPRTGAFELVGGAGQYGLTFDAAGRRFVCANRHPVWHVVLEPRQLSRNPLLSFAETVEEVSAVGADARVWPISADLTTAGFHPTLMHTPHAGTFTSASGVHVHLGDALPDGHTGSVFVMESAQNLVQRQVRSPHGVSFRSQPAREGVEFLASTDTWFRPVFAATGPDGALYIADMYRKDIDHPAYVPEESRRLFDFTAGGDRGRIYRVAASGRPPAGPAADLAQATPARLAEALGSPNGWRRATAQRLLIERGGPQVVDAVRAQLRADAHLARLHALWTLDVLDALDNDVLRRALGDAAPDVRENALRIAERRLPGAPPLVDAVLALTDDPAPRVRLHAALALGTSNDPRRLVALAALAAREGGDRWMRAAVLGSIGTDVWPFFEAFETHAGRSTEGRRAVLAAIARMVGTAGIREHILTFAAVVMRGADSEPVRLAALAGLARGLQTSGDTLDAALEGGTTAEGYARDAVAALMTRAAAVAADVDAPLETRADALTALTHWDRAGARSAFEAALGTASGPEIQAAAVRAIAARRDPSLATLLVERARWERLAPRVRADVVAALAADDRLLDVLLDAVTRGDVPSRAMGPARWRRLASHRDPTVRARAADALAALDATDARRAFDDVQSAVATRRGDPEAGARVFETHCAACHTFTSAGARLGPDLSGIRNQPADALLLHIVVPDHEITPGFEAYAVETRDGRVIAGRIEGETPQGVTVRDTAGQVHALLRRDIVALRALDTSLMPAGFEQVLSPQALADLLAYLKRGDR